MNPKHARLPCKHESPSILLPKKNLKGLQSSWLRNQHCRVLRVHESPSRFLHLAPDSLQSLSYQPYERAYPYREPDHSALARLTALTHLELADVPVRYEINLSWPPTPVLQELIIIRSPDAEGILLTPGALGSLRKLHVEERCTGGFINDYFRPAGPEIALCNSLLQLPKIQQISGRCQAFKKGMRAALPEWREVDYNDEKVSKFGQSDDMQWQIRMWKKQ